jgi:hypothetical protein
MIWMKLWLVDTRNLIIFHRLVSMSVKLVSIKWKARCAARRPAKITCTARDWSRQDQGGNVQDQISKSDLTISHRELQGSPNFRLNLINTKSQYKTNLEHYLPSHL